MKKDEQDLDEARPAYVRSDVGEGVRGKYFSQMQSVVLVTLDPDVAVAFPDDAAVNDALRSLMRTQAANKAPS
jgi:hypothetical protein